MAAKPLIPTDAEIEVVDRVYPGLSGLGTEVAGMVPAKVQESLKILADMGAVLDSIRSEQPKRLESYAGALVTVLKDSGLSEEQAFDAISALFSSVAVARLLADVAAGNLDPVAAVRKTKTAAAKKSTPAKEPADAAPTDAVTAETAAPAPAKKTTAKKASAKKAAPSNPAPVEAPVVITEIDESEASVDPDDFDLPVVEKPVAVAKVTTPAAVPVPTSIAAGLVDDDPADDDF